MRSRLAIKIHSMLERLFPERRLFLKSDTDTRFIRLRPGTQLMAYAGLFCFLSGIGLEIRRGRQAGIV